MHRNKSVNVHQFAMVPRADIPRSAFSMQRAYKTTFDAGYVILLLVRLVARFLFRLLAQVLVRFRMRLTVLVMHRILIR